MCVPNGEVIVASASHEACSISEAENWPRWGLSNSKAWSYSTKKVGRLHSVLFRRQENCSEVMDGVPWERASATMMSNKSTCQHSPLPVPYFPPFLFLWKKEVYCDGIVHCLWSLWLLG